MTTTEHDFAILILQPAALLPENEADRERILHDLAAELGVAGETERAAVTNPSSHGTGGVIRFPGISQASLGKVEEGPVWTARAAELFLLPHSASEPS